MELFEIEVQLSEFEAKRKQIKAELAKRGAGTKVCRKCKTEMDIDQFYRDKQKLDGKTSWCHECVKEKERKKRAA